MRVHKITTNINGLLIKQTAWFGTTNWIQLQIFKYSLGWQHKKKYLHADC